MIRLPYADAARRFFHEAGVNLPPPKRLSRAAITNGLGLAISCGGALAQKAEKGSAGHIKAVTSAVDGNSIKANTATSKDWPTIGLDYAETRFSKLNQINTGNVKNLGLKWTYSLESIRGVEATPLVVDGIMYVSASWSVVHAIDARTGKRIWSYDPGVNREIGYKGCCDVVNRGVALYKGKVYVGAYDGRLVAIDAVTGKKVWEKDTVIDHSHSYTITGAPRVVKGKVLIGNGGAEFGARGYLTTYDPDLNLIYIGTGNGSPWNRNLRSPAGGDNLYLASLVALNADTGKYAWHYQETPGDNWDYTSTQPMILADIKIDGKPRKVILHAPKNGFFFVIDRTNGRFISAKNFVDVNWATGYDADGRPIEVTAARSPDQSFDSIPGPFGAHNWHP